MSQSGHALQVLEILVESVETEVGTSASLSGTTHAEPAAAAVSRSQSLPTPLPLPLPKLTPASSLTSAGGCATLDYSWISSCAVRLRDSQACGALRSALDEAAESCGVEVGAARVLAAALTLSIAAKLLIVACRSEALCCCALLLLLHSLYHAGILPRQPVRPLLSDIAAVLSRLANELTRLNAKMTNLIHHHYGVVSLIHGPNFHIQHCSGISADTMYVS